MLGAEGISSATALSAPLTGAAGSKVQAAGPTRKEKEMASEMEATFLSMLLKEMRQTLEPDGGLFPGDSGDVQGGLFDLYIGRHIAETGGVGLATSLLRQMQAAGTATKTDTPTDAHPGSTPRDGVPPVPRS